MTLCAVFFFFEAQNVLSAEVLVLQKQKKKKRLTRLLALHNLALHTAEMTVEPKAELTFTTCPKCFISGGNTILLHLFHSVSNCSMSNINQATYRSNEQWMLSTLNKEICPFRIHFCEVNLNSCISSTILLFFSVTILKPENSSGLWCTWHHRRDGEEEEERSHPEKKKKTSWCSLGTAATAEAQSD